MNLLPHGDALAPLPEPGHDAQVALAYRRLLHTTEEGVWSIDAEARTTHANARMARMLGYEEADMQGRPLFDFMDEAARSEAAALLARRRAGIAEQHEFRLRHREGHDVWIWISTAPVFDDEGRYAGALGLVTDVTARKHAEAELRETRDRLRALSLHHEDQLNRERKRIAMEMHDECGQMLTAIKLQIDQLDDRLRQDAPALREHTDRLRRILQQTMRAMRNIAMDLRPPALDIGLVPALQWLAEDFSLRWSIECAVEAGDEDFDGDEHAATGVFRIAQEALSNVARHAQATRVRVGWQTQDGDWMLTVQDNGLGFDSTSAEAMRHFGLMGMSERALHLNGRLELNSGPGQGTLLTLRVPRGRALA